MISPFTKVCILVESTKKYNGNVSPDRFPLYLSNTYEITIESVFGLWVKNYVVLRLYHFRAKDSGD